MLEDQTGHRPISDLVEVPEIKTVIQLEDLKDSRLRQMIEDTFVLTSEVLDNLRAIFVSLSGSEGRGIFIKGHFGSGKSHLLSVISLLIKYPGTWKTILSQAPSMVDFERKLTGHRFLSVEVSLVQHRGSEFLEDIILRAIFRELGDEAAEKFDGAETRHDLFSKLKAMLKENGITGMVLLVDELSEFLRSKGDARSYNEDIRFLQYLGEEATSFPLWVIATLQEWIEETGEIHQDTFNKIKDRYRIRLNLGRAHIEELVSERLIHHKEGSEGKIGEIYDDLKSYFPTFPVTRDRFIRLYPVHPATSSLLDRLKPLFSEHRGVVDFIHFRLKGDPERHIPPWLDRSQQELLTPEAIFDHFLDRIRERSETQIYVERVFDACEDEVPELFQDPDQQRIALVVVKLLILYAISPVKFKYTVRHVAEMILFQVTPMEPEINYQFLHGILDRLAKEGAYIRVKTADDPLENLYFIDLKADAASIMRKRVRHRASELFPEDRRLFWKTATMVDTHYLPLGGWVEAGRQQVGVKWQHTQRQGLLLLRQLDEITVDEIEGLSRQWSRSETDFFLLVGTTHACDKQVAHVREVLLPKVRRDNAGAFLFWIPAAFEGDLDWLKHILAAVLILESYGPEASKKGEQGYDFLEAFIARERSRLTENFSHCYYHGELLWEENRVDISRFGYLSQEKFLSEFMPPLLERLFPRHARIQPFIDGLVPGVLKDILNDFLSSGLLIVDNHSTFGIRNILEGILRPMGLVKKKGNRYELQVNPRQNELARYFFERMGKSESVSVDEMYWLFRKGEYGLLRPHFEILILALLFSGHLVAYKGTNRKTPEQLARSGLKGVSALGRGEILGEALRKTMEKHPLVPGKFKDIPVTLASQEELWAEIKAGKPSALEDLETLKSRIEWALPFEAFKNRPWKEVTGNIADIRAQWDEVKVSLPSREGLDRFINASLKEPFLEKKLAVVEECGAFLKHAERALFVHQYLMDQRLHIPDEKPHIRETLAANGARESRTPDDYESLRRGRAEILRDYETGASMSAQHMEELFEKFQHFQEAYTRVYVEAHQRVRGGGQFEPYAQIYRSNRYRLLKRLDQLEMISVEHNRRSIDQGITSVLLNRCPQSPQDHLQRQPVCSCGFRLGDSTPFKPLKEIEREIDLGIEESLDALKSPSIQGKIVPFLEGLNLVGKKNEADAIRRLLDVTSGDEALLDRPDLILTPQVVRNINEAFRGKVVVVKRDLDRLYGKLVHRKYTVAQTHDIIEEWLHEEAISEDTYLHFTGREERESADHTGEAFRDFLEKEFKPFVSLHREIGHDRLVRAMITSLWSEQYDISVQDISESLPFLERGMQTEHEHQITQLAEMARSLRSQDPGLFDSLVSEVEEDPSFVRELWSALSSFSPATIFRRETILPLILKEAFERLLCEKPEKGALDGLSVDPEVESPLFLEQRGLLVDALETCHVFREKSAILKSPDVSDPAAYMGWESHFIKNISPVPSLYLKLREQLERIGTDAPPFLEQEGREMSVKLNKITRDFREFYQQGLSLWEKGEGKRPVVIRDIPSIISKKRGVPDHRQVYYVLMDGMRWDLWEAVKSGLFGKWANLFRVVREGALWAGQPTDTATHMKRFAHAFQLAHPDADLDELLLKVSGMDEKIHSEKGPLPHLFANILGYLEIDLLFRLRKLPPRTLLILFSDHGFVENHAFSSADKYASPRYIHGKDSPFEVIVPWAWVMRI